MRKVTGLPEQELLSHLSTLKDAELLYERGIYPQSTYIFKHAFTREVVYDSILTKSKKQIHEKIARAIEEIYKDNICTAMVFWPVIAWPVRITKKGRSMQGWRQGSTRKRLVQGRY